MNDVAEALNFAGLKSAGLIQDTYDNFIGGKWVKPLDGKYFDNPTPVTGGVLCKIAQSQAADIELALDAAHSAKTKWGSTSVAERARMLEKLQTG